MLSCRHTVPWGYCMRHVLHRLGFVSERQTLSPSIRHGSNSSSNGSSSTLEVQEQDQIIMKGLVFHGYHGALPEENVLGQKFVVDATLWADLAPAGQSDRLDDTIDYTQVYRVLQEVVQGPPRALQESVAQQACEQLLSLDPRISAVQLYIRKPHVALTGVLDSVGVQILRKRSTEAPSS